MIPKASLVNLTGPAQTSAEMLRLVRDYSKDLGEKASWPLPRFFDYVRKLSYKNDPKGVETVARPAFTMLENWPWRDCDDKSILIASWCYLNAIPFRFVAASNQASKVLHHVYVIATINGKDYPIDSTYQNNTLGKEYPATYKENLTGNIMSSLMTLEGNEVSGITSVLKKAGKVVKKGATFVIKTPGVKDAIASAIPGGSAALAKARAAASKAKEAAAKVKAAKAAATEKSSAYIDSIPDSAESLAQTAKSLPKWALPAAGAAVVLYLVMRKR